MPIQSSVSTNPMQWSSSQRSRPHVLARVAAVTLLAGLFALMPVTPVRAGGSHQCVETLPAGTYGNVKVAAGSSCVFDEGVVIEGNFTAKNPVDVVTSGATIHGNVTIDGATGVVAGELFSKLIVGRQRDGARQCAI